MGNKQPNPQVEASLASQRRALLSVTKTHHVLITQIPTMSPSTLLSTVPQLVATQEATLRKGLPTFHDGRCILNATELKAFADSVNTLKTLSTAAAAALRKTDPGVAAAAVAATTVAAAPPQPNSLDAARQKQRESLLQANATYIERVLPHLSTMSTYALDDTSPTHQVTGRNFLFVSTPSMLAQYDNFVSKKMPTFTHGTPILNNKEMALYSRTMDTLRSFHTDTSAKHKAKYGPWSAAMIATVQRQRSEAKGKTFLSTFPKLLAKATSCNDVERLAIELRHEVTENEIKMRKIQHGLPVSKEIYRRFPSLFTQEQRSKIARLETMADVNSHFRRQLTLLRQKTKALEHKLETIEPDTKLWHVCCPIFVTSVLPWRVGLVEGNVSPPKGTMRFEQMLEKLSAMKGKGEEDKGEEDKGEQGKGEPGKGEHGKGAPGKARDRARILLEYYAESLVLSMEKNEEILRTGACAYENGWGEPRAVSAAVMETCRTLKWRTTIRECMEKLRDAMEERKMESALLNDSMGTLKKWSAQHRLKEGGASAKQYKGAATGREAKVAGVGDEGEGPEEKGEEKGEEKEEKEEKATVTASAPLLPELPSFDFMGMPQAVGVEVADVHGVDLEAWLPLAPSFPLPGLEALLPVAPTNDLNGMAVEEKGGEEEPVPATLA